MKHWILLVFLMAAVPVTATAQQVVPAAVEDSVLAEAVRLATEGRTDSARSIIRRELSNVTTQDARYPAILFTAGVISTDPDSARTYFRRVSIEYSNSNWADRAILRLAQLAYAAGDKDAAVRSAEQIIRDYPFSPIRAEAAFIAARVLLDQRNDEAGCQYLSMTRDAAGQNIELANRAAFYLQRCAAPSTTAQPAAQPSSSATANFAVQVAAVQNPAAADELMRGLRRDGYDAQVTREDGYLKVRVGRFRRRADAEALARELQRRIGGQPFVVEIP